MRLSEAQTSERVTITKVHGSGSLVHRLTEMGFVAGQQIEVVRNAPLHDPVEYRIMGYEVSLRREEAGHIEVVREAPAGDPPAPVSGFVGATELVPKHATQEIRVALVGNPNCGKTSLFNRISGMNEHVGNYSGVTVDVKEAVVDFEGYKIRITDLPGTYSIAEFSPEERLVGDYIRRHKPDMVINVVDATNLERNLYLTTQLIDMGQRVVLTLNMWDEFLASGAHLNQRTLSRLLGMPVVTTIAKRGRGVASLLSAIVTSYDDPCSFEAKWVNYPDEIETFIAAQDVNTRYEGLILAESDATLNASYRKLYDRSVASDIATARYGFVSGALKESLKPAKASTAATTTAKIDKVLTHKYLGLPIFLAILYLTFYTTFTLGAYPMEWIEAGVEWLRGIFTSLLPAGAIKDLIISGVIDGVGSVIVFLPNILILFLFITIMEDTGYIARAAFITDKLMHRIGLHGKSFIPLVMSFGCNVPAIMSTRTIENRTNRLQTMLLTPFMSCSARLPVYILVIGAFFPKNQGTILFFIYLGGIVLAILTSLVLKKILSKKGGAHFVMELPPYRIPTVRSTAKHLWGKGSQYLKKMGGVILIAAVVIWALGYFPRGEGERSYLQRVGQTVEPVLRPLGFDWQMGVALMSGVVAKEVVVSSMGVIYGSEEPAATSPTPEPAVAGVTSAGEVGEGSAMATTAEVAGVGDGIAKAVVGATEDEAHDLPTILQRTPSWNSAVALSFLTFVLIYFPCIASVTAIRRESGRWAWALFTIFYTTSLAWICSFGVYSIALLFGLGG